MIAAIDVSKVLSSYESDFANKAGSRRTNIRVAAEYLNGTVLLPNQVLSFNKVVGARSAQRGFIEAPVIVNDELERGVGGGVCQVASTLHAAAVHGDIEIVRRRSHSRPSGYMPLGLDAVVIEDEVDLRIKNPYDTALIVHAFLPHPTRIRVELLGKEPPGKVEHVYEVREKYDFSRRVRTSAEVSEGYERRQKGIFGYDIRSVVRITYPNGSTKVKTYDSKYYPVPEVYWVAPGYDLASLPTLPEGANRVEIDGVAYGADGAPLPEEEPADEGASNASFDETEL
jgi:hypothetical protein